MNRLRYLNSSLRGQGYKYGLGFSLGFAFDSSALSFGLPITNTELAARADCGPDPKYQLTPQAWMDANTDTNFATWWKTTSSKSHGTLVNELSKQFGSGVNSYECGIKKVATCIAPACSDFSNNIWPYMALNAIVHLNSFFNAMFDGITNGQLDYLGLSNEISLLFFPQKDPQFALMDASFWIVAILSIFATALSVVYKGAAVAILGIGAFAGAGVQALTHSLDPGTPKSVQLAELSAFATTAGETARHNLESWANQTFAGALDSTGNSLINYTRGGSYISPQLPSNSQFESFFKKQMISRTIAASWAKQRYYVTFSRTNPDVSTGPPTARWYSSEEKGVYYVYNYVEDGFLKGYLGAPKNLDKLAGGSYNISGSDIAKASGRAWRQGGFNYTHELAAKRIKDSIASNGTLRPFEDGAGWEGTWNLPVCDLGTHSEWNSQYGKTGKPNKYDYLPCCCGPNCRDTKAFAQASNMVGSQTYIHGCKEQLEGTEIKFENVDYGFRYENVKDLKGIGKIVGIAVGSFFAVSLLILCCACCF